MKIFKKFIILLKKMNHRFTNPTPASQPYQVNPIIVLTVIGLVTTSWGLGTGIGAEKLGNELAQDLRNSPQNIENYIEELYKTNQISGSQREIKLQKLAAMSPILLNAADTIQDKGQDIGFQTAAQALFETMMNYSPGEKLGSLVGASSTGKGLDQIYAIKNITESIEGASISWTPFSAEEALLVQQIQDVMGMDADALFLARMRTKINVLRNDYVGLLTENPCDKEQILTDFRANLIGFGWGAGTDVYGEGEKFPSHEAFIDWLIAEATTIDVDIPCDETTDEDSEIADCVATPDMYAIAYPLHWAKTYDNGDYTCMSTYTVSNLSKTLLDFKTFYLVTPSDTGDSSRWITNTVEPGDTLDITDSFKTIWGSDIVTAQHTKVIVYRATSACQASITDQNEEEWASFIIELDCPCND